MAGNETEASTRAIRRKFSRECLGKKSILTDKRKAHSSRVIRVFPRDRNDVTGPSDGQFST
jgi:hypothetical protein